MKTHRKFPFLILGISLLLITACMVSEQTITPEILPTEIKQTPEALPTQETEPHAEPTSSEAAPPEKVGGWWNDVVFYEIFVRSFKDSDGDGIGDFQGIIQMLDYLNDGNPETTTDLGVGGIWLMPIMPSPSYHGYDVTNYEEVNPDYGTMEDFRQLLSEAHKRGIHVIIDFVVNHTSNQHPWFLAAQESDASFKDWYVWSETDPRTFGPWGQDPWHNGKNGQYYYGIFWEGMPDLNYENPKVTEAIHNATRFWLEDIGVDGFRVDAARYLFEDGFSMQDTKGTIQWFQDWRDFYKPMNSEAYTVGEVWADLQIVAKYTEPKGLDSLFMFDLSNDILGAVYSGDASRIIKSYLETLEYFPDYQFSSFLTNHDQQRVTSYFGKKISKSKLAAFVYLTGPGTPFVYYGEEIGMTGNKPDEMLRTPMQWSSEANAGFSAVRPWEAINDGWDETNVAVLGEDPDSILSWYRELIALRNQHPALRTGTYLPFTSSCRKLYVTLRQEGDDIVLTLANVGLTIAENCTISVEASSLAGTYQAETLWGREMFTELPFGEDGSLKDFFVTERLEGGETLIVSLSQP